MSSTDLAARVRREPPRFRRVSVRRIEAAGPRLARVVVRGDELAGFEPPGLAASVRILLPAAAPSSAPAAGDPPLVMPVWNGNEFRLPDGSRPAIRTLTPRRFDTSANELTVEIVRHGAGALAAWLETAGEGSEVAISGPGRGYDVDPAAPAFLLIGDETAIPAISQLLEHLPPVPTTVRIEAESPEARIELPEHAAAEVGWLDLGGASTGTAMLDEVRRLDIPDGARVWVAGEAAAVQRIRKHLFDERGLTRQQATVRGYWKHGRAEGPGDAD